MAEPRISREDLEGAVREAFGGQIARRRMPLITVVALAGVGTLVLAYYFGRRLGRLQSAIIEVRRL